MVEKRRMEDVKSHRRWDPRAKKDVRVPEYQRPPKPKRHMGVKPDQKREFEVRYWRDNQGRLVSKRVYKPI